MVKAVAVFVGLCSALHGFNAFQVPLTASWKTPTNAACSNYRSSNPLHHPYQKVGSVSCTRLDLSSTPIDFFARKFSVKQSLHRLAEKLKSDEVLLWRLSAVAFFSTLLIFQRSIDVQLMKLWTYLLQSSSLAARIFRTDSYEWVLAVSAFSVYIHGFGLADRAVRKADEQGRIHPWKKFRLQDRFEADKHRRMIVRQDTSFTNSMESPLRTKHSPWNWQGWVCEFWVYVLPLLTWDILSPRRHRRLAAFAAPTTVQILRDITCGLLLYDFFFFCGHILMHKVPFIYKTIHAKHHKIQEVRAGEIVRLSIPEEVLEVGFSIVALNLLGAHPVARSIYNLIITFLLTELHCGFDFPWTPQNVVPFGLATGSRRHHYHHRNGRHYYQKFFYHVDRLFGFYQKDDGSLHGDSVKRDPYIPASWK